MTDDEARRSAVLRYMTVREGCRRALSLDGADAQALEGALSQAERELKAVTSERDNLEGARKVALRAVRRARAFLTVDELHDAAEELKAAVVYLGDEKEPRKV